MVTKTTTDRIEWPADRVQRRPVEELIPYARNARKHGVEQVEQIAASIKKWGWTIPVLVDEAGGIIAGHGRVLAAKRLGITEVPVMQARGWSDAQKRAYVLADNKIALNSTWEEDALREELADLKLSDDLDIGLTGFSADEVEQLLSDPDPLRVSTVATGPVNDRFWISVRGPLSQQAEALQGLKHVMSKLPGVEVEIGTTELD